MKVSVASLAGVVALSLLFVPAPAPAAAPAGRYTVSGGVVQDNKTGLHWQQATQPTTSSFSSAMTYCSGNAAALPGSGWRLPELKELFTLLDESVTDGGPSIDRSAFPGTRVDAFWSSTPRVSAQSTGLFWVLIMDGSTVYGDMSGLYSVRCVH